MTAPRIVTGFHAIDVMNFSDCSECGQSAGTCCMSRKGKKLATPHEARSQQYDAAHPDRRELCVGAQFDQTRLAMVREYNRRHAAPAAGETK
jgi:hypothetical protein